MNRPALALSLSALAACASTTPPVHSAGDSVPAPPLEVPTLEDGYVTYMEFQANAEAARQALARLDALDVFTVGELLVAAPMGAHNCYGPCEDDTTDQAWMVEHATQTARAELMADTAEDLAVKPDAGSGEQLNDALEALRGLEIIEVTGIYSNNSNSCYVGFCPGDDERIWVMAELADALKEK